MKPGYRLFFAISLFFIIWTSELFAGAWPQAKGGYFLKIAGGYVSTGQEFNHTGDLRRIMADFQDVFQNSTYSEYSIQGYFEYGLTPSLTLIADVPFKIASNKRTEISNYFPEGSREATFTTRGFGDLWTSARLNLLQLPLVTSVQAGVKVPLGYETSDEISGPALGNGETEYQATVLVGQGFHPLPLYFSAEIGYRVRGGALNDEVIYGIEMGYTYQGALLKVALNGVSNTAEAQDIYGQTIQLPLDGGGGVNPDRLFGDHDFLKLNAGFIYPLGNGLALDGGVFHMLSGKNIVAGTMVQLGLVLLR